MTCSLLLVAPLAFAGSAKLFDNESLFQMEGEASPVWPLSNIGTASAVFHGWRRRTHQLAQQLYLIAWFEKHMKRDK